MKNLLMNKTIHIQQDDFTISNTVTTARHVFRLRHDSWETDYNQL